METQFCALRSDMIVYNITTVAIGKIYVDMLLYSFFFLFSKILK